MAKEKDSKHYFQQKAWYSGISNLLKEPSSQNPDEPTAFYYSENLNTRTDPYALTLNPATVKESGNTVVDFVKWADITPASLITYLIGDTGNIYSRTTLGAWNLLHQAASSHGNGLQYFYGDDYLYYPNDSNIGRYGPLSSTAAFTENWSAGIKSPPWNNWGGTQVTTSSKLLTITSTLAASYYGIERLFQDLTGMYISNQLVSVGSRSLTSWEVYPVYANLDASNQLFWYIDNANTLRAYKKVAGSNTILTGGTYDPAVHKYFKIREAGGTVYFEYSTDGLNWLSFASTTNPFAVTSLKFGMYAGTFSAELSTTSAVFTNYSQGMGASSAQFADDFLTSQGGVPQNTNSLGLVAASSQYATAADSASLSVTGDLTLEAAFYLNSLPTVGNSMVLTGKWDESGVLRSYIMDIYGVSGFFGDGSDGSLTISSNTTEAPIDSACTGATTSYVLAATNASFAIGQRILIHQTQGVNAGQWERNVISGYTAGSITLQTPLIGTYATGAQVRVLKQYTTVTVNIGITYTAKAWNGTVGGILSHLANSTVSINGSIVADGCGFRGQSNSGSLPSTGAQGEGTVGTGSASILANGNGGGGGSVDNSNDGGSGAGGSNLTSGTNGGNRALGVGGTTGILTGSADLTTMVFGGAGGNGGNTAAGANTTKGGNGGGIVFINGVTITMGASGLVSSNGANGGAGFTSNQAGHGGGAAGSVLIKCQTATLGTNQIVALGGTGGTGQDSRPTGGNGGNGGININYLTSYTGTTNPTLNVIQDNTLVTTTTYQARLGISNDGTALEYLTKNLGTLAVSQWNRLSISWASAGSLANFYLNGSSIGATTGTKVAIHDNASLLYVGAKKGASAVGSFLDGLIDDVRIWNAVQSASNIFLRTNVQLTGSEGGLAAYYKLNGSAADSGPNSNTLTLVNTPTYSTNVPFVDPSTRLDIDTSFTTTGSTYALGTTISETTANKLPFTPVNDPQKSIDLNIAAKGSGNWTVTVHDITNKVIASQTILNANLPSAGYIEFVFSTPWRIVIGKSYHIHITSTVADGTLVSSSSNVLQSGGLATGNYHTYFGFLVTDTLFHPALRWLNFLLIGNERYLAKWDGAFYSPNLIAFPQGTHVRCYGVWGNYVAVGTWQERTDGTAPNVYDFSTGKIYFWDGISLTFNFSIDVPEGQVNSIFGMDDDLFYFAGWKGDLMQYTGTYINQSGAFNGKKIKRIPYLQQTDYMEIYPQAIANYQGILYMGLAANTNSTTLPQGVYSWGALYPQYSHTLGFEHVISTDNKGSTVKIGCVYPVQQKLLISWKDGISYGVDVVDPTAGIYHTSGLVQTNLQDGGDVWRDNLIVKTRAEHLTLQTGEGIVVGYKLDRETSFETANSITEPLKKSTSNTLSNGRMNEFQLQVQLTSNGSTTPTLLALSGLQDALTDEQGY